jgi:UDP-N-acetylglucosamine 2-epimerase (non-hydrolysing)
MVIAGARPNFMKVAPIVWALDADPRFEAILVHTGQHYDPDLSEVFFRDLDLRQPDTHLAVGSGSHAVQTARIMERFEPVLLKHTPDILVVVGDVNSTAACALVAAKVQYAPDAGTRRPLIAHVEAGLRSNDWSMPEEVNRVVTDRLSDLLFTPSADADENLHREGVAPEKIHLVGNVMIDTLHRMLRVAEARWKDGRMRGDGWEVRQGEYALVTLHRPSNVDDPEVLSRIIAALTEIARRLPILFPVHPRTRPRLASLGSFAGLCSSAAQTSEAPPSSASRAADHRPLTPDFCRLQLLQPLGYLDFLALEAHARMVITDSGGVQEETTALGVPCLTVRENSERPVTIREGTNILVGTELGRIISAAAEILETGGKRGRIPVLWDGLTAGRIVRVLADSNVQ